MAAVLFLQPLHVFVLCRKSQHLSQQRLSLCVAVASSSQRIIVHFSYLRLIFKRSFEGFFSLSFNLFTGFAQREGCVLIYVDEAANLALSKFTEQAEGDSPQSAVSFLTSMQRTCSDKPRSNSFVCLILAICNYTHLFWVMFLQWVLWGTAVWLELIFLLFVIFLRVRNKKCLFLISCCLLQQNWAYFSMEPFCSIMSSLEISLINQNEVWRILN